MRYVRTLTVASLLLICAVCCPRATYAQLPKRLERCLPYPTFGQELQAMNSNGPLRTTGAVSKKHVVIDSVNFDGPISLPVSVQERMLAELRQQDFDVDSDWLNAVVEVGIRGTWQDKGYFKVDATAKARVVGGDASHQHVALTVHVDEGQQFFLGDLKFRSADPDQPLAFSQQELRQQVPLEQGDIFNADKVRKSLDNLQRLYDSQGYIDFVAEPDFKVDESQQKISLTLVLDQQRQFHIGSVEVLGLDSKTENALRSHVRTGDIFVTDVIKQFIEENKSALTYDASMEDVAINRNVKEGIADLTFDFFKCPTASN